MLESPLEEPIDIMAVISKGPAAPSSQDQRVMFVQGSDAQPSTPDQFEKQMRAEHAKWGKLLASSPKI